MTDIPIYSNELAKLLGKSERQTRRIMSEWEKTYPNQVVGYNGTRRFVTHESLVKVASQMASNNLRQILDRIDELDTRVRRIEKAFLVRL